MAGGVTSKLSGGEFWDGARNGLISASLNHVAHGIRQKIEQQKELKPIDFKESSDKEKISQVLKGIRQARLNGDESLDIRNLFTNMNTGAPGWEFADNVTINEESIPIHLALSNTKVLIINSSISDSRQVGPFNGYKINGISKNGYWDYFEYRHYRAGTNMGIGVPLVRVNIPSSYFSKVNSYLNGD